MSIPPRARLGLAVGAVGGDGPATPPWCGLSTNDEQAVIRPNLPLGGASVAVAAGAVVLPATAAHPVDRQHAPHLAWELRVDDGLPDLGATESQ